MYSSSLHAADTRRFDEAGAACVLKVLQLTITAIIIIIISSSSRHAGVACCCIVTVSLFGCVRAFGLKVVWYGC